eukprot:TRINITY_DN19924_c0_g1_i9.p1 TRINITY_DN19924_c0_g1~~TRINITY_DN19924_c0_g1_i9.p1  ORF type:complete len:938 (+),score=145.15 TRINITY_DN19924_c0_g1_i9:115-2928(+)
MPYKTLPWGAEPTDEWASKVTLMHPDTLKTAWLLWAFLAGAAAFANLVVMGIIIRFKSLRSKQFNRMILGLALPDFLFSGACSVTCTLHRFHGTWYGGSAHCDVQGFYVTFGFAGSIWMNVIISREINLMARSARAAIRYVPLKTRAVVIRIAIAYGISLFLAASHTIPGIPFRANAVYGLACLAVQEDRASTLLFWLFYAPMLLGMPLLLVFWHFVTTYLIIRKIGIERCDQDTKAIFAVFIRLLTALIIFWGPAGVLIWIVDVPVMAFVGGTVSHLQGLASAIIYSRKSDINQAMRSLMCRHPNGDSSLGKRDTSSASSAQDWETQSHESVAGDEAIRWAAAEPLERSLDFDIFDMDAPQDERWHAAPQLSNITGATGSSRDTDCINNIFDFGSNTLDAQFTFNIIRPDASSTPSAVTANRGSVGGQEAIEWAYAVSEGTEDVQPEDGLTSSSTMRSRTMLLSRERTPMKVVPLDAFLAHGKLPHSRDHLQRDVEQSDFVVFISHRWWNAASNEPDNVEGQKYGMLCRALEALKRRVPSQSLGSIVVWIDYACIDQDDVVQRDLGISSLVSYAARSDFLIIPVGYSPESVSSFRTAMHPIDLVDYGERAWCRLEVYVFLCVAEITQKPLDCYAYGLIPSSMSQSCIGKSSMYSASAMATGQHSMACGLLKCRLEGFRRLGVKHNSAAFSFAHLPTNGLLTVEDDRELIASVQQDVRQYYGRAVLDRALNRMHRSHHRSLILDSKQLNCDDAKFLVQCLQNDQKRTQQIQTLSMCCNLLDCQGAALLVRELTCMPGSALVSLDLSENLLGTDAAESLQHALKYATRPLHKLCLARNRLAGGSALIVAGACQVQRLLDLSDNQIGNQAAQQIASVLADEAPGVRASTQMLVLAKNEIESQAGEAILAATHVVVDLAQNPVSPAVFAAAAMRQAGALV